VTGRQRSEATAPLTAAVFAFLLTIGLMAGAAALAGFANALLRGGGAAAPRWLTLIAVAGLGGALVISSFIDTETTGTRRAALGTAAAGIVTAVAVAARWLGGGGAGPLEIAVFAVGVGVALAAPWLAARGLASQTLSGFTALSAGIEHDLAATDVTAESEPTAPHVGKAELILVVLGVAALFATLAYVLPDGPLGHDESVYALKARSWLEGTPTTGFGIYRPLGMPMVGLVVLQVSDAEVAFRIAAALLGAGTVIAMWAIGRTMLGPVGALIGTATFVVSESYLRRATEFLNDLLSAGLLLAVLFFVWLHFERYPNRWWLLAAAPAAAAAYYVRYGTVLGLVVIAVVAGAIWFRRLGDSWRQIAATAGLLLALLLPGFWYSRQVTGSILGVFNAARTAVGGGGGGLADYAEWFPEHLAGTFGAIMMVAAMVYTVMVALLAKRDPRLAPAARTAAFLTITALALTFLLGLFTHGEPRFVYLPLMALLLVGGQAVAVLVQRLAATPQRVAAGVLIAIAAYALATGGGAMANRMDAITGSRDVLAETGAVVHGDAGGETCTLQAAYIPQLTWYSVCATFGFGYTGPVEDAAYLTLFEDADRQPTPAQLDDLLAGTGGVPITVVPDDDDVFGDGYVYEFMDESAP
jgi:hypothetical protein